MPKEIKLIIPSDFELPSVLKRTTPEENAAILSAAPFIQKILSETNYTQRIDELTSKLKCVNHESRELKNAVFEMEGRLYSAIDDKLSEIDTDILSSVKKIEMKTDSKLNRDIETLSDKTMKLTEQIGQMSMSNSFMQSMEQFMQRIESQNQSSLPKSSIMIGQDNEKFMERILIETFSTQGSGFELIDKRHFSGDHIFRWDGMMIMVEDKKYKETVPFKETSKALRDFSFHPECDVLIMISMDTPIRGHETANGIDVVFFENRLVLFVSNFASNGDLRLYIKRVIQPILVAGKTIVTKLKSDPSNVSEKLQYAFTTLPMIMNTISDQEKILIRHIRDTTETVNAVHRTLNSQKAILAKLIEVLRDDEPAIYGSESVTVTNSLVIEDSSVFERTADLVTSHRVCKTCKNRGHDSRNCPEKHRIAILEDEVTKPKPRVCKTCSGTGHDSRNCPLKK